jgi:hypothetical protein
MRVLSAAAPRIRGARLQTLCEAGHGLSDRTLSRPTANPLGKLNT